MSRENVVECDKCGAEVRVPRFSPYSPRDKAAALGWYVSKYQCEQCGFQGKDFCPDCIKKMTLG